MATVAASNQKEQGDANKMIQEMKRPRHVAKHRLVVAIARMVASAFVHPTSVEDYVG